MGYFNAEKIKEKTFNSLKNDVGKQYLLYLLNANNQEPIKGKTKLIKELFFIANNVPSLQQNLNFEPDSYGPSSDKAINNLEEMSLLNLIKVENNSSPKVYSLTKLGKEFLEESNENIDVLLIEDMKSLINDLTKDELLALVYFTFPETTDESLVKGEIDRDKVRLAINLYKKDKISLEKASEIAGLPLLKFLELIKEKNINVELNL